MFEPTRLPAPLFARALPLLAACVLLPGLASATQNSPPGHDYPVSKKPKPPTVADRMPKTALMHQSLSIIRYNPLGLQHEHRLMWRMRLSDSDKILWKDTYVAFGPEIMATPSLQRFGVRLQAKPIAVFEFFALAEYLYFLGNFDYVQSYKDAAADFSTEAQKAATERGENYSALIGKVSVSGRLQAKVGPIAVRSTNRMSRFWFDAKDEHKVFFDIYTDLLTPVNGWTFWQDNDVLYINGRLIVGLRHTWSQSFLSDDAMQPVAADAPAPNVTHRVGPIIAYRLRDDPKYGDTWYRRPTLLVLAQWWVKHPYRTGQEISQAIPWLVVGFAFNGRVANL